MTEAQNDLVYRTEALKILNEGVERKVSERQVRRYESYDPPLLPVAAEEWRGSQRLVKYRRSDVLAVKDMRARQERARTQRTDNV